MILKEFISEFSNEYTIVVSSSEYYLRYSKENLIRFFVNFGKLSTFVSQETDEKTFAIAKYETAKCVQHSTHFRSHFETALFFFQKCIGSFSSECMEAVRFGGNRI